jgi:molecular chaperone GrpE
MENNETIDKDTFVEEQENEKDTPDLKKGKKKHAKEEVEKLERELAEARDQWVRTLAEYDNFRKRSQKEREALYGETKAEVLSKLLPAIDNFERAAQNTEASYEDYRKGVEMTANQLLETMKGMQVEPFGEAGERFDPNLHSAVMHVEDGQYGENEIVDVFQKGYKMGERVLRPATVKVAN